MPISARCRLSMLVFALGCSHDTTGFPDRCNVSIVQFTPSPASARVGDTLALHVAYTQGVSADCIPSVPASSLRWSSGDSLTVTVDSLTGVVVARRVGAALISVHLPGSAGSNLGGTQVTVTAP